MREVPTIAVNPDGRARATGLGENENRNVTNEGEQLLTALLESMPGFCVREFLDEQRRVRPMARMGDQIATQRSVDSGRSARGGNGSGAGG
jgi:hypothetical protein